MPDGRRRTAQDREAALRERERKRAEREGGGRLADPLPAVASDPPLGPDPPPASASPSPSPSPSIEPLEASLPASEPETDQEAQDGYETGEHDLEAPSGTRRVTHRETVAAQPDRQRRPTRRRRSPVAGRRGAPRTQRPGRAWVGRVISVVALILAAGLIWFLVALFEPFQGAPQGQIKVTIPPSSPSSRIGDLLARDGVVASSFFFELRATLAGERGDLRAGVYHLQRGMSYSAVLSALTKAPPVAKVTDLTITEGQRRAAIAALLRSQHVRGNYLAATRSSKLLDPRAYGVRQPPPSLEGFLFPDTYQLVQPVQISALVSDQLRTFKRQFAKLNLAYTQRRRLTPYDVLTIASLIEAETPTVHDRPLVASVIYNRLADGMMLGLDSTTQYATGNYTRPLTVSQLHSSSPYNTRTHVGLPPTPIDNPGLASMQAAAHPAQTGYLYFFAKPCQHGSVFATSYAQFLALGRRYQSARC